MTLVLLALLGCHPGATSTATSTAPTSGTSWPPTQRTTARPGARRTLRAEDAVLTGDDETRYLGDSLLAADENSDGPDDLLVLGWPGFDQEPTGFFLPGAE